MYLVDSSTMAGFAKTKDLGVLQRDDMGIEVDGELELDNVVTGRYATVRTVQRQSSAVNLLAFSPRDEVRRLQDEVWGPNPCVLRPNCWPCHSCCTYCRCPSPCSVNLSTF